jgi:hypothetical protein
VPKTPFYLTGQVGGQPFSVHAEGERVILTRPESERQEVDLVAPRPQPESIELPLPVCPLGEVTGLGTAQAHAQPLAPGESALDDGLRQIETALTAEEGGRP